MPYMYHYRNYFSQVDPENVDRDRFPLFRKAKPIEITVAPGEVLFIPIGWWHHVRALDLSISISFSNFRFKNRYPESPFQRNNATRLNEIENRDAMMAVSAAYV
jgi:ribosomal protein L16 Arg81 hydroxylase